MSVGTPPSREDLAALGSPPGLCARCNHARVLTSARSAFLRCGRSDVDPTFLRYPQLPVGACQGWEPRSD